MVVDMAKQTVTTTIKERRRKVPKDMVQCNMCGGKGYHKKPKR